MLGHAPSRPKNQPKTGTNILDHLP